MGWARILLLNVDDPSLQSDDDHKVPQWVWQEVFYSYGLLCCRHGNMLEFALDSGPVVCLHRWNGLSSSPSLSLVMSWSHNHLVSEVG